MPLQPFQPHYPFTDEKLAALRTIVPEAFEDGRLNFDTLREVLEPNLDPEGTVDDDGERFGLLWPGKKEARRLAAIPSKGTLAPVYGQGLKADGTPDDDGHNDSRNVFIEGENLEVLKIMQKAYAGRVKMIYIDPPYNTGNDFVYDDNFTEPLEHYLRRTGQIDDEGQKLTTNTKSDGRFHSKWLSMMYPRLRLARNLLREDGVIFVSIDDNEVHNLRQLMNEVFGEENFVTEVIWQKVFAPKNSAKYFSTDHEYLLVYSKQGESWTINALPRSEEANARYTNRDSDPRGPWMSDNLTARNSYADGLYSVVSPSGNVIDGPAPGTYWRVSQANFKRLDEEDRIWWGEDGNNVPRLKRFLSEVKDGIVPQTLWKHDDVGNTQDSKRELNKYVQVENPKNQFNTIKPLGLLDRAMHIGMDDEHEAIILDFFSGSGTTAHSVLKRNLEHNKNYRFVSVQYPEKLPVPEGPLKSIADIGYTRLKNYGNSLGDDGIDDRGFRVFDIQRSQLLYKGSSTIQELFEQVDQPQQRDLKTLLWEVILQEGFPLDSKLEKIKIDGLTVTRVTSNFHDFALLCCFAESIAPASAQKITLGEKDVLICRDSALDDQTKLRLSDKGLVKTI